MLLKIALAYDIQTVQYCFINFEYSWNILGFILDVRIKRIKDKNQTQMFNWIEYCLDLQTVCT